MSSLSLTKTTNFTLKRMNRPMKKLAYSHFPDSVIKENSEYHALKCSLTLPDSVIKETSEYHALECTVSHEREKGQAGRTERDLRSRGQAGRRESEMLCAMYTPRPCVGPAFVGLDFTALTYLLQELPEAV